MEGVVQNLRFHSVTSKQDIIRYIALIVEVRQAHKVTFNKYGAVVTPNFKLDGSAPTRIQAKDIIEMAGGFGISVNVKRWEIRESPSRGIIRFLPAFGPAPKKDQLFRILG